MKNPKLKIDEGKKIDGIGKVERRIVAGLFSYLNSKGFKPVSVSIDDFETLHKVSTVKEAMELIFDLDGCDVNVSNGKQGDHYICLVCGNGLDIISNWDLFKDDRDGFDSAMNTFIDTVEDYE